MNKIKFIPKKFDFFWKELLIKDFGQPVNNPINYEFQNTGELYIRGDKKEHYKEYWITDHGVFLIKDIKKYNGHKLSIIEKFNLYPTLPHKEYLVLNTPYVYNKLTLDWKNYVGAYFFNLELRNLRREARMIILK